METIVRSVSVYLFLLVLFRVAGRRTLAQTSTFDLALLLIISETTQNALIDTDDSSLTSCFLAIGTLIFIDIVLAWFKSRSSRIDYLIEDRPVVVLKDGIPDHKLLKACRIDEDDILSAARHHHGINSLGQIALAVLETNGQISIVPQQT